MDSQQAANAIRDLFPTIDLPESALAKCGDFLKEELRQIIKYAYVLARHAKRSTINCNDVNQALSLLGHEAVYGSQRFHKQRFLLVEGKDIFFAEDAMVPTSEVHSELRESLPSDLQMHSHWLSIEGSQPLVPENEPLPVARERKERPERAVLSKDFVNRKHKIAAPDTLQTTAGGIVQGGAELRLPVEHELTSEQQTYYEQIQQLLERISITGDDESEHREFEQSIEKIAVVLQTDAALQPLVPYLVQHAAQRIHAGMQDVQTLQCTLKILHSLVRNSHVDLSLYAHDVLPLILTCLLHEAIGENSMSGMRDAAKVRDSAAKVLASAVDVFDDSVNNIHIRISQKLSDCLDKETSFTVQYGAVRGLESLGMTNNEAVTKLLQLCHQGIEIRINSLLPTSLSYQQGTACLSLIRDVLSQRINTSAATINSTTSPLSKKVCHDDSAF